VGCIFNSAVLIINRELPCRVKNNYFFNSDTEFTIFYYRLINVILIISVLLKIPSRRTMKRTNVNNYQAQITIDK
jgi:hypothetical protein